MLFLPLVHCRRRLYYLTLRHVAAALSAPPPPYVRRRDIQVEQIFANQRLTTRLSSSIVCSYSRRRRLSCLYTTFTPCIFVSHKD